MTDIGIDWDVFASRVPAGTRVRNHTGDDFWEGIALENYSSDGSDWLRLQCFDVPIEEKFHVGNDEVQFLIDDKWLTFDQIMQP